jgi:hypothetical protein
LRIRIPIHDQVLRLAGRNFGVEKRSLGAVDRGFR